MGLTDVTLGWYEDANGLDLSSELKTALGDYLKTVSAIEGGQPPKSNLIHGRTLPSASVVIHGRELVEAVRLLVAQLSGSSPIAAS